MKNSILKSLQNILNNISYNADFYTRNSHTLTNVQKALQNIAHLSNSISYQETFNQILLSYHLKSTTQIKQELRALIIKELNTYMEDDVVSLAGDLRYLNHSKEIHYTNYFHIHDVPDYDLLEQIINNLMAHIKKNARVTIHN